MENNAVPNIILSKTKEYNLFRITYEIAQENAEKNKCLSIIAN